MGVFSPLLAPFPGASPIFLQPAPPGRAELQESLAPFHLRLPTLGLSLPHDEAGLWRELELSWFTPFFPHILAHTAQGRKPEREGWGRQLLERWPQSVLSPFPFLFPAPRFPSSLPAFVQWSSSPPTPAPLGEQESSPGKTPGAGLGASVPVTQSRGRRDLGA